MGKMVGGGDGAGGDEFGDIVVKQEDYITNGKL